jgi:hypothetical protein
MSRFHCGWEWHMRELRNVPAVLIYSLASRLTAKKTAKKENEDKIFDAAAKTTALSFGLNATTVRRAIKPLCKLGFFEKLGRSRHGTNKYRVISHDEWAKKHPGQCAIFQPWSESCETEETGEAKQPLKPKAAAGKLRYRQQEAKTQEEAGTVSAIQAISDATALARELSHLSNGEITFADKQRIRLAELLKEFTAEEIKSEFKPWLDKQDLLDPKNVSFLPGQFVQVVDGLAYSARKRRQEAEANQIARTAAVLRMQAEAEAERQEAERNRQAKSNCFDPLGDLLAEGTTAPESVQ